MSKKPQYTARQKFIRYLEQMLHWQRLPPGSAERAEAVRSWLRQGQHAGGKPRVAVSTTDEGQRIKNKRAGWLRNWRQRIRGDAALTKLADEAGVLDTPRPDAQPGDFANPDPRVYSAAVPGDELRSGESPEAAPISKQEAYARFASMPAPKSD